MMQGDQRLEDCPVRQVMQGIFGKWSTLLLLALSEQGRVVHGCDLSAEMGREAGRRLGRANRPLRLTRTRVT